MRRRTLLGMAARQMELAIESDGVRLAAHLATPPAATVARGPRQGLVLCHGFPSGPGGAKTSGQTHPELADRLAEDAGWSVLAFNFRGTGESKGEFSLGGWMTDLHAAVDFLLERVDAVWLAGSSTGGALALCVAAEDERVRGVATLAAPADFGAWADAPEQLLASCREIGVIRRAGFPADFAAWARELREVQPTVAIGKLPPRPVLVVHGSDDDVVPLSDARALAEAAEGEVELRIVNGAGHRLRHDPRAVAVLLGWLDRQEA